MSCMSDLGIDVEDVAKYKWMFSSPTFPRLALLPGDYRSSLSFICFLSSLESNA